MYDVVEEYLEVYDCNISASDSMYVNTQLDPSIVNEADAEDSDRFYLHTRW